VLQNLLTMSRINPSLLQHYPPSMDTRSSNPLFTWAQPIASAQISGSFPMHQLASFASIHELVGEYGCPPRSQISPSFHRAYNPLDLPDFPLREPRALPEPARPVPMRPVPRPYRSHGPA
jgi:hypothetical protein